MMLVLESGMRIEIAPGAIQDLLDGITIRASVTKDGQAFLSVTDTIDFLTLEEFETSSKILRLTADGKCVII